MIDHKDHGLSRSTAELAQRRRIMLDVAAADLEAAEARFGAFHPTTSHFRDFLNESRRSWERLQPSSARKFWIERLRSVL